MQDTVKCTGVDAKGYGKIYKYSMRDSSLPLLAKTLLAYLCSYAGSGYTAFPHREKVISDIGINKDTFCKHIKTLETRGYINRHKTFSGTVYEIKQAITDTNGARLELKQMGYGTVPKLVMLDASLSAKAKGLYAYFCSFAGAGKEAWPKGSTIMFDLKVSSNSLSKYLRELVEKGYVTAVQGYENGRYTQNTYKLNDVVKAPCIRSTVKARGKKKPHLVVSDVVENFIEISNQEKATSEKVMSEKTVYQKTGRRNIKNNSTRNISLSCDKESKDKKNNLAYARDGIVENRSFALSKKEVKELIGYMALYSECIQWASLKEQLGHFPKRTGRERFLQYGRFVLDEVVAQLFSLFKATSENVLVGNQLYRRTELLQGLMDAIDYETIRTLYLDVVDRGSRIKNVKKYLQASVLNLALAGTQRF